MIEINLNPVAKPRMTQRDKWKKRAVVVNYRNYKDNLNFACKNFQLGKSFEVLFFIEMPKSWSKKKKHEMLGKPHQQKPDIDNLLKGLMDALLKEDSHVYSVKCSKIWSEQGRLIISNTEKD